MRERERERKRSGTKEVKIYGNLCPPFWAIFFPRKKRVAKKGKKFGKNLTRKKKNFFRMLVEILDGWLSAVVVV